MIFGTNKLHKATNGTMPIGHWSLVYLLYL